MKKKLSLPLQILIALIAGIVVGFILYAAGMGGIATSYLKPFGDIFVNLLKFIVVPVVLLSMIDGIISMNDMKKVGSVGIKTVAYFMVTTAIACIILGMGLPTTSAYVIAASILAPSLVKLGLPLLTAHLFVFYFACLSAITPPVALAAYAGAGLAKCNPMSTAVEACKLGFAGFIAPFAFCYSPALMLKGDLTEIISVCISALIGTIIISMGFQGWLLWKLNPLERVLFVGGGMLMFIPGTLTDIIGIAIAVVLILINVKKWKKHGKAVKAQN